MAYIHRKVLEFLFGQEKIRTLSPYIGTIVSPKRFAYTVAVPGVSKKDFCRTIWRFRRAKLVEIKEGENGYVKAVLTEVGKKRMLSYQFDKMEIKKLKPWDGRWRIVAFDIPEIEKAARNALGGKMRELGLVPFQKSLWIYPYECKNEIDFVASVFGVEKYVHFIVTHSITNDDLLRRRFGV